MFTYKINNDLLNEVIYSLIIEKYTLKDIIEYIREGSNLFNNFTNKDIKEKYKFFLEDQR